MANRYGMRKAHNEVMEQKEIKTFSGNITIVHPVQVTTLGQAGRQQGILYGRAVE